MATRLPLLPSPSPPDAVDRVEIQTPCDVAWDSMYGDDQVRHCGRCRQNVYNVAALPRADALRLIASRERVCLRIYRRPDGTVVTADCWSRLRAARRRGIWAFAGMLVVVGWAQLAAIFVGLAGLRSCAGGGTMGAPVPTRPATELVGEPSPPPPVPLTGHTVTMGGPRIAVDAEPKPGSKTRRPRPHHQSDDVIIMGRRAPVPPARDSL